MTACSWIATHQDALMQAIATIMAGAMAVGAAYRVADRQLARMEQRLHEDRKDLVAQAVGNSMQSMLLGQTWLTSLSLKKIPEMP